MIAGKTPMIIGIDVEPDERSMPPGDRPDWEGFEQTWAYLRKIRAPLARATGAPVHFSWFLRMDPQIAEVYGSLAWVATRYHGPIEEMQAEGDEIGLHPHCWRWIEERATWIEDLGSQAWVARCVRESFAAFEQSFGRPCRSVRMGDAWMNDPTMDLLDRLGAHFDLTVEPGRTLDRLAEPFTGSLPDYARAPRDPYHPARRDFRTPGGWWPRRLWEIPLSTGRPAWAADVMEATVHSGASRGDGAPHAVYAGWHDRSDDGYVEGWAYDASRPEAIVAVDVFADRTLIATLPANAFRPDLLSAGIGDGRHAFAFPLPERLKDGEAHTVRVMVAGTSVALQGTPQTIRPPRPDGPPRDYVTFNLAFNASVFRGMLDAVLARRGCRHLALVVRSDAGRDPVQRAHLEASVEHILDHPETARFAVVTPEEAIGLLHPGAGRRGALATPRR